MNPQWGPPPDGDFARYVEQLSHLAQHPKPTVELDDEPSFEPNAANPLPAPGAAPGVQRAAVVPSAGAQGKPMLLGAAMAVGWFFLLTVLLFSEDFSVFGSFLLLGVAGLLIFRKQLFSTGSLGPGLQRFKEELEERQQGAAAFTGKKKP